MTEILLVVGVWTLVGIGGFWVYSTLRAEWRAAETPTVVPSYNLRPRRLEREEPPYSPEGWGPPDSEVVSTEGDDYLARMHRPRPQDDA